MFIFFYSTKYLRTSSISARKKMYLKQMTTSLKNNQTTFIRTKLDKEKNSKPFLWLPSCRHPTAMFVLLQMRSSSPSRGLADKTGGSLSHFSRNASPASESDTRKTPTSQNVHKLQTGSSLSYDKRYPETPVSLGKLDIPRTVFLTKKVYKDGFLLCVTILCTPGLPNC